MLADHFQNTRKNNKYRERAGCRYIYQNELDKVYWQLEIAYNAYKSSPRRVDLDQVLSDKASGIASNPRYDEYQRTLA